MESGLLSDVCIITRLTVKLRQNPTKGAETLIPRISLTPSDTFLPFKLRRRQFPIRLSFAMTINKSQEQTFNRLELLLPQPVFTHGQLYVAFSRVRSLASIRVQVVQGNRNSIANKTRNIVFHEVLKIVYIGFVNAVHKLSLYSRYVL